MTGRVTISERNGVRYLQLGTEWIQGAMRLSDPIHLELDYIQRMMVWLLFLAKPQHIVQLGLGAGSLTRFTHHHFPDSVVSAVELNPDVLLACHELFALPADNAHLHVHIECAEHYVARAMPGSIDVLQVDLYHAQSYSPACQSPEFYRNCARSLSDDGILVVNLLGTSAVHSSNLHRLQAHFAAVVWLPECHDGNLIAIAFKTPPSVDFDALYERADHIEAQYQLEAKIWVDGLLEWMQQD